MNVKATVGAVLIGLFCCSQGAAALESGDKSANYEKTYGEALPPIGYVKFCGENPEECLPKAPIVKRLQMTVDRWHQLSQVNSFVNNKIQPVSDQDLYGEPERWTYPVDAGDCEDYLLLKKRYLEGMGFASSALLITVVLDEKNEGHAILTVAADDGDYVLDNRRNEILRWSDTNYKFLKRQSTSDPRQWVALIKQAPSASGTISAGNRN
jgi:predicted transglutaminase-like cysteine proteinase